MGRKTKAQYRVVDNRVGIYIPRDLRCRINEIAGRHNKENTAAITQAQVIAAGLDLLESLSTEEQFSLIWKIRA